MYLVAPQHVESSRVPCNRRWIPDQFWPCILEGCGKVIHDTEELSGWYLMFSINLSVDFISFYWIPIQHRVKKKASGTPVPSARHNAPFPNSTLMGISGLDQRLCPGCLSSGALQDSTTSTFLTSFPKGANEARMRKHLSSFHFPIISDPYTVHKSWLCLSRSLTVVNTPSKI